MKTAIGKALKEVDKEICRKIQNQTLTCHGLARYYGELVGLEGVNGELKELAGHAAGFTGYSEFLIYRTLLCLYGSYVIKSNKKLEIDERKHFRPDFQIWKDNTLKGVVSVKVYWISAKTIDVEMEKLRKIKATHPEMRALIIIFDSQYEGIHFDKLTELRKENSWFDFLNLLENNDLLSKSIFGSLGR